MNRHNNWPEILSAHLRSQQSVPFQWAFHDCCTFAADAVKAITEQDPMADLRGTYLTASQAARLLKAEGGLLAAVSKRLGPAKAPALAQRGDVVLFEMPTRGPALGVCVGPDFAVPAETGLGFVNMKAASAAWSV